MFFSMLLVEMFARLWDTWILRVITIHEMIIAIINAILKRRHVYLSTTSAACEFYISVAFFVLKFGSVSLFLHSHKLNSHNFVCTCDLDRWCFTFGVNDNEEKITICFDQNLKREKKNCCRNLNFKHCVDWIRKGLISHLLEFVPRANASRDATSFVSKLNWYYRRMI